VSATLKVEILGDAKSAVRAADQTGRAYSRLEGDLGKTEGRARRARSSFAGAAGGMAAMAGPAAAAGAAVVGAGAGLVKLAGFASDSAEALSAAQQVYGKGFAQIESASKSAATTVGLSQTEYLDAAKTLGVFGMSAGKSGTDLAGFSQEMVKTAADLASFHNTDVPTAIAAIGSGLRGEAEPLRQFGILLDDASLRQQALSMGLIKTTKTALTPQQKVLASQQLILKQVGAANGDFARTSSGAANQQRILTAQIKDQAAKLGQGLLPAGTRVLTWLNSTIPKVVSLGSSFGSKMRPAVDGARAAVAMVTSAFKSNQGSINSLRPIVGALATALGHTLGAAFRVAGALISAQITLWGSLAQAAQWAWDKVTAAARGIRDAWNGAKSLIGLSAGPVAVGYVPTATAGGAYATAAVGAPFTAMGQLLAARGGSSTTYVDRRTFVNVDGALDPVAVGDQLRRILRDADRRDGR